MKIVHFTDAHIGVSNYGSTNPETGLNRRVEDFLTTFDKLIDFIEENQVDLVLFAGDLFHKHTPPPSLLRQVAIRIRDIADIATLVIIPGNHDMKMTGLNDTPMSILSALAVDNVHTTDTPCVWEVETTGGRAVVAAMPYPRFSAYIDNKIDDYEEKQRLFDQAVAMRISSLSKEARTLKRDDPCFFVGHFTVNGCDFGGGRIALDFESYTQIKQLRSGPWDYVALGHIHKHQVLSTDPPVVYAGSLDRIDFGEEMEDKGFTLIESVGPALHWKFVPLPVRPMVTLNYDVRGESDPNKIVISKIAYEDIDPDALVRINIQCDYGADINQRSIRVELKHVYMVTQINVRREQPERTERIEELEDAGISIMHLDKHELLDVYWHTQGVPITERDAIHNIAAGIFEELDIGDKYG